MNYEDADKVPAIWQIGDTILNRYEVRDIHRGGMGQVYRIYHREWRTELAVKSPLAEYFINEQQKAAFTQECQTWINLGIHPNIVSCYFIRQLGAIPRIFADYIDGGSLREWIDSNHLYKDGREAALKRIIEIAKQMAWGLHYSHEKGVIHQDVKPGNVLMTTNEIARIADFGLAKARGFTEESLSEVKNGTILSSFGGMTPAYCSPEQAAKKTLTRRTDCWSWAVSVLEMFTGGVVWQSGIAAPMVLAALNDQIPLNTNLPELPEKLKLFLGCCLQIDPDKRPHTMKECANKLDQFCMPLDGINLIHKEPEPLKLSAGTQNNHAVSLLEINRVIDAEEAWEKAINSDPNHIESTFNYALFLWREAKINDEDVLRRLEALRNTEQNKRLIPFLTAQVHLERGDHHSAMNCLEDASTTDIADTSILFPSLLEINSLKTIAHTFISNNNCGRIFEGSKEDIRTVCISPDGSIALTGGSDQIVRLWDIASGRCLKSFNLHSEGHNDYITAVCISYDNSIVASGADDGTLCFWDVKTGHCLQLHKQHSSKVTSVSLSSDSRYAITTSHDCSMRLWDVKSRSCVSVNEGSIAKREDGTFGSCYTFFDACILGRGLFALSANSDMTIRLWDLTTNYCQRVFRGHTYMVTSLSLSVDDKYVLSGSADGTMRLWLVETGQCCCIFNSGRDSVNSVSLNMDAGIAVSGHSSGSIRVWNVRTGRCHRTFKGYSYEVASVSLTPCGHLILSGGDNAPEANSLLQWKAQISCYKAPFILSRMLYSQLFQSSVECARILERTKSAISGNDFVAAAKELRKARIIPEYTRNSDVLDLWGKLYLHLKRGTVREAWLDGSYQGHTTGAKAVCFSSNDQFLLTGGNDKTLRLWDVKSARCLKTFSGHTNIVSSVAFSPSGRLIVSGSYDRTVRVWDIESGKCLYVFNSHPVSVSSVAIDSNDTFMISGCDFTHDDLRPRPPNGDSNIRIWEIATGRCLRVFNGNKRAIKALSLSSNGQYLLSAGGVNLSGPKDNTLRLWSFSDGNCLRNFEGHAGEVYCSCISHDDRLILSGSSDKTVRLWDAQTGQCLHVLSGHTSIITSVCFSSDGQTAVSASWDSSIRFWDTTSGQCFYIIKAHSSEIYSICLSNDSSILISAGWDYNIYKWRLDWELEDKEYSDWDDRARPFLANFLTTHTPYAPSLPAGGNPNSEEIIRALTRQGNPSWTEADFKTLLYSLACAGYGWLRPEGVRRELNKMAFI